MATTTLRCLTATLAILLGFVALSEQVPAERYSREKDFLEAFGEWLRRAQMTKNIDQRADPAMNNYQYPAYDMEDPSADQLEGLALKQSQGGAMDPAIFDGEWIEVPNWPKEETRLGQIGGVAADSDGNLVVFHRADHSWTETTFAADETYAGDRGKPIAAATLVTLDKAVGKVASSWGQNRFFLPHGLEIDHEGNYWVTDLALHQVFKFGPDKDEPLLTLGKAFEPATGNEDLERFCKPTDVAVASNGDFFVADGYCNSRILKYSSDGTLLGVFAQDNLWVPHSLALAEDLDTLCVADRENRRILCYKAGIQEEQLLGYPDRAYFDEEFMGKVYAIDYSERDGYLYAVTAPTDGLPGTGFTIDMYEPDNTADVIAVWTPAEQEFTLPHDLAVTDNGKTLYVGEIADRQIWKFSQSKAAPPSEEDSEPQDETEHEENEITASEDKLDEKSQKSEDKSAEKPDQEEAGRDEAKESTDE